MTGEANPQHGTRSKLEAATLGPTSTKSPSFLPAGSFAIAATVAGCLCIVLFFWQFFFSGLDLVSADLGDGRFCIAIMEHWFHVFRGLEPVTTPLFFYPESGTLGYSEVFFLYSLPYAAIRSLGGDPFLAFELALILIKATGFASMLILLRRGFKVDSGAALFGAILFTVSNLYVCQAGHVQLVAVAFLPLIVWLGYESFAAERAGRISRAQILGASAGLLTAMLFISSFYVVWFAFLFGAPFSLIRLLQARRVGLTLRDFRGSLRPLLAALLAFLVGLVPFILLYLPALKFTGKRDIADALVFMPRAIDLFNVGPGNWLWGKRLQKLFFIPDAVIASERRVGWPPFTLAAFFLFAVLAGMRALHRESRERPSLRSGLVWGLALVSVLLFASEVKFGPDLSLWRLIYRLVPGAAAIRAPGRLSLVINVAVVLVIALGIQALWSKRRESTWAGGLAFALSLLILAEQINLASTHNLSRKEEAQRFAKVQAPPKTCSDFFVIHPRDSNPLVVQTDAMMLANQFEIPTLDGYSGWSPKDWALYGLDGPKAVLAASSWASRKGVANGLCALDLSSKRWLPIAPGTSGARYEIGETIDFSSAASATYVIGGWAQPEPNWGTWMVSPESELSLDLLGDLSQGVVLSLEMHAFLPPARPTLRSKLFANGTEVANWFFTRGEEPALRKVPIPKSALRGAQLELRFETEDSRSPIETGVSPDGRKLSLALSLLRIDSAHDPAAALPLNAVNGLDNSGFEDSDTAPWIPFQNAQTAIDRSHRHEGRQSLAEIAGAGSLYQDAGDLTAGRKYTVTAWLSTSGGTAAGQMALFNPDTQAVSVSRSASPGLGWQPVTVSFIAGPSGHIRVHLFRTVGTGTVYWDDVQIRRN